MDARRDEEDCLPGPLFLGLGQMRRATRMHTMDPLPDLWYPRCASCGKQATPRAGLGDALGPHPMPHDVVTCSSCGQRTTIDERTVWIRERLEGSA